MGQSRIQMRRADNCTKNTKCGVPGQQDFILSSACLFSQLSYFCRDLNHGIKTLQCRSIFNWVHSEFWMHPPFLYPSPQTNPHITLPHCLVIFFDHIFTVCLGSMAIVEVFGSTCFWVCLQEWVDRRCVCHNTGFTTSCLMTRIVITNLLRRLRLLLKGYVKNSLESRRCKCGHLVVCMMKFGGMFPLHL